VLFFTRLALWLTKESMKCVKVALMKSSNNVSSKQAALAEVAVYLIYE